MIGSGLAMWTELVPSTGALRTTTQTHSWAIPVGPVTIMAMREASGLSRSAEMLSPDGRKGGSAVKARGPVT